MRFLDASLSSFQDVGSVVEGGHLKSQCPSKALKAREKRGRGVGASRGTGGAGIRGRVIFCIVLSN